MTTKLQQYFPTIRSREEVMAEIHLREDLKQIFYRWQEDEQREFLDFCTGVRGIKMLYDFFAKEILNPETSPERINELLSLLLKQKVKILTVLPNDSSRIADENSLIITDIVVELEDGSIANIEIQKIGYKFPGQRSACYSSDLLLRQYKRVRSKEKKKFSYKDIKSVYTIVLFEMSTKEFHRYPDTYLHYFEQKSDSGLQLDLLQKYLFIPLDIFRKNQHNGIIKNKLDAWLAFLSMDNPDMILAIVEKYPEFRPLYEQAYEICRNIEEVMGMFSKELYELDRNTVQYMIDEMQEEINQKQRQVEELNRQLAEKTEQLAEKTEQLAEKDGQLAEKDERLAEKNGQLSEKDEQLEGKDGQLAEKVGQLTEKDKQLSEKDKQLKVMEKAYKEALKRIAELESAAP